MKSTLALAGLLALGSTALPTTEQPVTMTLKIQANDAASSFDGQYFRPGIKVDGGTLINLDYAPRYFYIDASNSQLVMIATSGDIVGNAYVDTSDKGILKFSKDASHDYGLFAIDPQDATLSLRGASDRWFWCPVDGQVNGTVAIGTTAGEGCEQLKGVLTGATD